MNWNAKMTCKYIGLANVELVDRVLSGGAVGIEELDRSAKSQLCYYLSRNFYAIEDIEPYPQDLIKVFAYRYTGVDNDTDEDQLKAVIQYAGSLFHKKMYDKFWKLVGRVGDDRLNNVYCWIYVILRMIGLHIADASLENKYQEYFDDSKKYGFRFIKQIYHGDYFYFRSEVNTNAIANLTQGIMIWNICTYKESDPIQKNAFSSYDDFLSHFSGEFSLMKLGDLGILQVVGAGANNEAHLYFWINNEKYALIPCKTKSEAKKIIQRTEILRQLIRDRRGGIDANFDIPKMNVICLRDMLIEATIYSGRMYYLCYKMPKMVPIDLT